jgi:2-iminoacetate synthase
MKNSYSVESLQKILADPSPSLTEDLAGEARRVKEQFWGRTISLYSPIYLSNLCSSHCIYCGFNCSNRIKRAKLTINQLRSELEKVSGTGIENILLLTGESYEATPLEYLVESVRTSAEYFSSVGLEIHPLHTYEYRELFRNGADSVTVYQETYDRERYKEVHLAGLKKDYDFRIGAPARIAAAGFRQLSLGILLGLHENIAADLVALFDHLRELEKDFPGVEYSLSFPRLRAIKGHDFLPHSVDDISFIRIICLTRIMFPRVGINLSTRENAAIRDHAIEFGVTRISAGSNTSVGGYSIHAGEEQEPQFDVMDNRNVTEIIDMLKYKKIDPVFTDWRRIENEYEPEAVR